ncbi:MAG: hypothetical protein ABIH21_03340 [Patescibacteria group bacterium]
MAHQVPCLVGDRIMDAVAGTVFVKLASGELVPECELQGDEPVLGTLTAIAMNEIEEAQAS